MTARGKRLIFVAFALAAVALASFLVAQSVQKYSSYFYSPTQVADGEAPSDRTIRVGGMVREGSVQRMPGSIDVQFTVTDFAHDVVVRYSGILPDLFKEASGVVTRGRLDTEGVFVAEEVMAKHDESYLPPEVADIMQHAPDNTP